MIETALDFKRKLDSRYILRWSAWGTCQRIDVVNRIRRPGGEVPYV
jgi:hypothetical protein